MDVTDFIIGLLIFVGLVLTFYIGFMIYRMYAKKKRAREKLNTPNDYEKVFKTIHELTQSNKEEVLKTDYAKLEGEDISEPERYSFFKARKLKKLKQKQADRIVFVLMELNNGTYRTLFVPETNEGFAYNKKFYVFNRDYAYFFHDLKMYGYYFQESFNIPVVKRKKPVPELTEFIQSSQENIDNIFSRPVEKRIKVDNLKKAIEASGFTTVENAFDPRALKRFLDTEVILQVMGGAFFTKIMKLVLIFTIIIGFLILLNLGVSVYNSGVFEKIGN